MNERIFTPNHRSQDVGEEDFSTLMPKLKLHEIAPVVIPSRVARVSGGDKSGRNDGRAKAGLPAPPTSNHSRGSHSTHRGSFVSDAKIFGTSRRHSSQIGTIRIRPPVRVGADGSSSLMHPTQPQNHHRTEPIPFDPFSDVPCYPWLIQDPLTSPSSRHYRQDPAHLQQFREWLTLHFPKVITSLKALHMLHDRPPPKPASDEHVQVSEANPATEAEPTNELDDTDSDESDLEEPHDGETPAQRQRRQLMLRRREAQHQAWRVLFDNARLLSVTPGDEFVTQDATPARDVFFVLSGQCQLVFQPKFLDVLVQKRDEIQSNNPYHKDKPPLSPHRVLAASSPTSSAMDTWMRRISLSTVTPDDASEVGASSLYPLRLLTTGEYFGVEACAFRFVHHSMSAISHGALQRNAIGIASPACLHVLVVPFLAVQDMRNLIVQSLELPRAPVHATPSTADSSLAPRRRLIRMPSEVAKLVPRNPVNTVLAGCGFREDDVDFLRHTFVFQSMQRERLQFLATQLRLVHVPKHEYLFTTGQEVLIYLVKSGQLRVFSPEQVKIHSTQEEDEPQELRDVSSPSEQQSGRAETPTTTIETRHVELEILQVHDMVGLMEASLLQPVFSNYCLATSTDVWVYVVPPVALFSVLAHEPTCSTNIVQNLIHHHSWYKARKFTALNRHNKQKEFRLSLGAQRKSPIPCSRCGWSGHSSTSLICIRASSPKSAFIEHLLGKDEQLSAGEVVGPEKRSSLGMRGQRVASQLQRQPAVSRGQPRNGSVVMAPAADATAPTVSSRKGSEMSGSRALPSMKGSLLPGLADLAALLGPAVSVDSNEESHQRSKTELEKALDRLDSALDSTTVPSTGTLWSPVRPQTQQHQRASTSSSVSIRDEALKAVIRLATASQLSSPRGRPSTQGI